jgi:peptidoglycan/xylan/chitin deacetylase (PgdA/CDA1 family)
MRRQARQGLQLLVKAAGVTQDTVRPPSSGVVVLAYHRVGGGTRQESDLEPDAFAEQMSWLRSSVGVVSIDDGLDQLTSAASGSSIVVTFDDGTADFIDHALPALVANNVPATYYIATNHIEKQLPFPGNGTPMTWAALAEALSTGLVTIGSHTHNHAVLDKLSPDEAEQELKTSAQLIEDRLGVACHHFAYPKGVFGGGLNEQHVARYYRSAALANCGVNVPGATNPLRLDRSPVQRSDQQFFFRRKALGGLRLEGQLRSHLNRRRYRSATN